MGLNIWGSCPLRRARFNSEAGRWQVTVEREGRSHLLRPRHLMFAMGVSGYPMVPSVRS